MHENLVARLTNDQKEKLTAFVLERRTLGEHHRDKNNARWGEAEKIFWTEWLEVRELEKEARAKGEDIRRIRLPKTYRKVKALIGYNFNRINLPKPRFWLKGTGTEDFEQAEEVSFLADGDYERCGGPLHMHDILQNCFILSVGYGKVRWSEKSRTRYRNVRKRGLVDMMMGWKGKEELVKGVETIEGAEIRSCSPRQIIVDPAATGALFHEGEFVIERIKKNRLWVEDAERRGIYHGIEDVEAIKENDPLMKGVLDFKSLIRPDLKLTGETLKDTVLLDECWAWMLPEEWELPRGDNLTQGPELMRLVLANDVLVGVRSSTYPSMPYFALHANPDLSASFSPSAVDMARPWQTEIDETMKMRRIDKRKKQIGSWKADPSIWDTEKFADSGYGDIWELREEHWGKPGMTKEGLEQFKYESQTEGFITEMKHLEEALDDATMSNLAISGEPLPGKRSASEVIQVAQSGTGPLEAQYALFMEGGIRRMVNLMVEIRQSLSTVEGMISAMGVGMSPGLQSRVVSGFLAVPVGRIKSGCYDFLGPSSRPPPDPAQAASILFSLAEKMAMAPPEVRVNWSINRMIERAIWLAHLDRDPERFKANVDEQKEFMLRFAKMMQQAQAEQQAQGGEGAAPSPMPGVAA